MAYEIPQQLEHKERIIYNLTVSQLGWAALFGTITLIVLLRNNNWQTNALFAIIPLIIGGLFVYADAWTWLRRMWTFYRQRHYGIKKHDMVDLHRIKNIDKDCIVSTHKVAILEITPINFRIKTELEKNAIIVGFQKFLNSFEFPLQMLSITEPLNLDSYFEKSVGRQRNKALGNDVEQFIAQHSAQHHVKNRRFYVALRDAGNIDVQVSVVTDRLRGIGLFAKRLGTKQLIRLLRHQCYATNKAPDDVTKDTIPLVIGLSELAQGANYVKVNEKYCRIITAMGYPRNVELGFLDKLLSSQGDYDISLHIEPYNINTMLVMLNKELIKQKADLYTDQQKGTINPSLEIKYKDTLKVLEELQKGEEKLFTVSLYINCKADSLEALDLLSKKVESELNGVMIIPSIPYFQQAKAFRCLWPTTDDLLKVRRNVTTKALSAFFPFTSPYLHIEQEGVVLGLNRNKVPIIRDIFALSNPNGMVLATSGAGKSYFTKLFLLRQYQNGTKVIIIDPQAEYLQLVEACKGQVITISRDSKTIINPMDLMGHDFLEKRLSLMDLFRIMFGDLTEVQKSILDRAIQETYAEKGITVDKFAHKDPPRLQDLYRVLEKMSKKATQMEQFTYSALINRLYVYTQGVFNFLNKETNIDFSNNMVCFNIGEMPKQVKPVMMFLILDYVYMKMKESKDRKILVIDEAWSLLGSADEASYIFEIVKTCRKFNMGLLLITQDVADLVNSKAGHAVLANSAYSLLLRQKPAVIESIVKTFFLSDIERNHLLSANQGEGILICDNDHQELTIFASPMEHAMITQKLITKLVKRVIHTDENISISNDAFYRNKELIPEQVNTLRNAGFSSKIFVPIGAKQPELCWAKENNREGNDHAFLCSNIIHEVKKYNGKWERNLTVEADIIVTKEKEILVFEIETGINKVWQKERIRKKFTALQKQYGKSLFVVLTKYENKQFYETLLPTCQIILRNDVPTVLALFFSLKKRSSK